MKIILTGIISFLAITLTQGQASKSILVQNKLSIERKDELIVFTKSLLQQKLGKIADGKYIIAIHKNTPQLLQFDDLDKDGAWDEAVLLHSFKPYEIAVFTVKISDHPATIKAVVQAHVRQRHKLEDESFGPSVLKDTMPYNNPPTDFSKQKLPPFLTEGPAWENDKVGFRKYFDIRNTNDIWGKTTSRMVLDEVGVDPAIIYHNFDPGWGMDILKVGKSLGAGALALQINQKDGTDSLVRLGSNTERITYDEIADGPIRAIFTITYNNWKIMDGLKPVTVKEAISIWGGQYFFENKVTIMNAPANAKLVTGTINFYSNHYDTAVNANCKALFTYDVQSENHDKLGLGIIVPKSFFANFGNTPGSNSGVMNTYTVAQKITNGRPLIYRYVTAWEKTNTVFSSRAGFDKLIQEEMLKMGSKPVIK